MSIDDNASGVTYKFTGGNRWCVIHQVWDCSCLYIPQPPQPLPHLNVNVWVSDNRLADAIERLVTELKRYNDGK